MTRTAGFLCCATLLAFQHVAAFAGQAPVPQTRETTLTASIEGIDKASRTVTLKGADGVSVDVAAPDQMQGFDSLRVGDRVTITYLQAVAVSLRKPGDPAPPATPTTTTVRKDRKPGSETRRQRAIVASIEAIDPKESSLSLKGPQGRVVAIAVSDPTQLQSLKVGDTVNVTYDEALLVKIARPSK